MVPKISDPEIGKLDRCAHRISTHLYPSAIVWAGALMVAEMHRSAYPGAGGDQASTGSATLAGFLATSFSTIVENCAPTERQ